MPNLTSIWAFLGFILGFGFIIFIHELGHFLVAKWVGIRVTQFAIGFGHSLLTYRKGLGVRVGSTEREYEQRLHREIERQGLDPAAVGEPQKEQVARQLGLGETEYRMNWLPLGGYVKMVGQEDLDPSKRHSEDPRSFMSKSVGARAAVISAGVLMNLIFAVLFFIIAFSSGVDFPPAVVGDVEPDSPAAQTYAASHENDASYLGLRPGDRIAQVNGSAITDFMELTVRVALSRGGEPVDLTVLREDQPQPLHYRLTPRVNPATGFLSVGIHSPMTLTLADGAPLPEELAETGLTRGVRIAAVDGQPVEHSAQYVQALKAAQGRPVPVTFEDAAGQTATVTLTAQPLLTAAAGSEAAAGEEVAHLLGLMPPVKVLSVEPGDPAAEAGMQADDVIAQIGAHAWPSYTNIREIIRAAGDQTLAITVLRAGRPVELKPVAPRNGVLGFRYHPMAFYEREPIIAGTLAGSPAEALGLVPGSRILSVSGNEVANWTDLQRELQTAARAYPQGGSVNLRYQLNIAADPVATGQLTFTGEEAQQLANAGWYQPLALDILRVPLVANDPWGAVKLGVKKTNQFMMQTYLTIARLFQGTVRVSHLRGPVGIVHEGTRVAEQGWTYLMFFLGIISVNLVVINFLPIPIVDGGQMVFLLVEKIKGSAVSVRVQNAATVAGLALIASIFLMTLFYDIQRLFWG